MMYGQVHANRVLYRDDPQPGEEFRQIVVVELEQFQVRIFEGTVVQLDPKFLVENPDAEYFLHGTLKEALADVEKEVAESVAHGWKPYHAE
jgi:hypothetical protein